MLSTLCMRPSMPRRDRVRQQRNGGKDERGQQEARQRRIIGQYQPDHAIELDGQQCEGHGVVEIVHDRHMRPALTLTGFTSRDSREVDSLGTPKGFRSLPCWTGYPRLSAGSQRFFGYDAASRSASARMFRAAFTITAPLFCRKKPDFSIRLQAANVLPAVA